ncbi:InlB B-repeat-containing protein, partial [Treponema sp. R6D11]
MRKKCRTEETLKKPSLFLMFFIALVICACENPWMSEIIDSKTVTFNSNGGTPVPSQTLFKGDHVRRPMDPTKNGFNFAGWYTDNET